MPSSERCPGRMGRLFLDAASSPRFRPRAAVEPVAAGGRPVVAQPGEARQLLARFDSYAGLFFIREIGERPAIDLFCHL